MPAARRKPLSNAEFEAAMKKPPRGGFSAWQAAQLSGVPYRRVLDGMRSGQIEVFDLGGIARLSPKVVRQLREVSREVLIGEEPRAKAAAA